MNSKLNSSIKYDLDIFYGRRHPRPPATDELALCAELSRALGGRTEVITPVGRIDLLRDDLIIETKIKKYWKQAIGQLYCYDLYYERPNKGIGIIGEMPKHCPEVCQKLNLILLNYSFNEYRWRLA
ncbi:MAG: hypothetical protein QNJ16_19665 [Rhodobacter sp.]|nr:hypothetical protein [Rhodobacter sp.]